MKTDLFQSCGHCWVFQICWHIECRTFTSSSFRIWNSSTGIPSHPLALSVVMLSKAHLTLHSRMSGSRWVITPMWCPFKRRKKLSIIMKSMSASCCSVTQSHPTFWNPTDCSTPGFPVLHCLLKLAETHVHWVSDVIQQSHPLLSPSSSALNLSHHQGLFQWVGPLNKMARVLELQLQHQSVLPMNIQVLFHLGLTTLISLRSKGLSRVFSNTTVQNINSLMLSLHYGWILTHPYMTTGKTIALTRWMVVCKVMSAF